MYTEEIYTLAKEIYGEESEQLRTVCSAVELQLKNSLADGYTVEDCKDQFILAAAATAVEMYVGMTDTAQSISSYSAGNISVTRSSAGTHGNLSQQARLLLTPYLKDEGFAFMGVDG